MSNNTKYLLIAAAVAVIGYLLWQRYKKNKVEKKVTTKEVK